MDDEKKNSSEQSDVNAGSSTNTDKPAADKKDPEPKISLEKLLIIEEITELLSSKNILDSIGKFNADSEEKEVALEFAKSHIQFLNEIVESDHKKGIGRSDPEIRDLISHINLLLRKKDEFLFNTMVVHSPNHYRNVQEKILKRDEEAEEGEEADR